MPWSPGFDSSAATMRPCSRPNCCRAAESSGSPLLVHKDKVLALSQTSIDRAPRERPTSSTLARLAPIERVLQSPAGLLVIQQLRTSFQDNLTEDLDHGAQVLERIQRPGIVQSREIAAWAAASSGGQAPAHQRRSGCSCWAACPGGSRGESRGAMGCSGRTRR